VDGQDLSHLIKSRGRLAESEALAIFCDILKGLGFAHGKGLVHRDIKPSNVLVDKDGRARIMDFGISIMAGGAEKSRTATGAMIGSPWYMSPEQILHPRDVDQRTDIYALGIVLYEMLTGGVPFDAETDFGVRDQQIRTPAKDPRERNSEISGYVAQIVLKAMAKDASARFQNCRELAEAIDAVPNGDVRPPSRVVIAALVATLVVSAGITGQDASPTPAPPSPTPAPASPTPTPASPTPTAASPTPTPPSPTPTPPPRSEFERKIAYNLIQSASEKASVICTHFEQLKRKERVGLPSARSIQNPSLEERILKQIREHKDNISNALREYSGFLDQLAKIDAGIVQEEFHRYSKALKERNSFQQIQIAGMTKRHTEQYRGNKRVDVGMMMATDCDAVHGPHPTPTPRPSSQTPPPTDASSLCNAIRERWVVGDPLTPEERTILAQGCP
jgi:serine/threonine protein kinase